MSRIKNIFKVIEQHSIGTKKEKSKQLLIIDLLQILKIKKKNIKKQQEQDFVIKEYIDNDGKYNF